METTNKTIPCKDCLCFAKCVANSEHPITAYRYLYMKCSLYRNWYSSGNVFKREQETMETYFGPSM